MLVKPEIVDNSNSVEMDILEPIIAAWMETQELKTITELCDQVELQIIDIGFNDTSKTFSVYLSDGIHFVEATIDRKLSNDFKTEKVDVYDIVHVLKSTGHPANDNFILVMSTENLFFLFNQLFQNELTKLTNNPQCEIGCPTFYRGGGHSQCVFSHYNDLVPGIYKI